MAKDFVLSKCFPDRNKLRVERWIERERTNRNEMRERLMRERIDENGKEISLYLKTKTFLLENDSETFKDDCNISHHDTNKHSICTICIADIENGDKNGDLDCGHEFHSKCLKEWIIRRNSCPLCIASDIAQPKATLTSEDDKASHGII